MSSLFQMFRCGHCSHFYVCAHLFTIVFRHSEVRTQNDDDVSLEAVVTPTTRGFREALKNEGLSTQPLNSVDRGWSLLNLLLFSGIEFSMPLHSTRNSSNPDDDVMSDDEADDKENDASSV